MVRYKNRYLVVNFAFIQGGKSFLSKVQLLQLIEAQVQRLHGDFGVASIRYGFDVKYLNPHTQIAVIRVRHGPHKLVASSMPFIRQPVILKTIKMTATILQAFKFIRKYQLRMLEQWWKEKDFKKMTEREKKTLENLQDFTYFKQVDMVS